MNEQNKDARYKEIAKIKLGALLNFLIIALLIFCGLFILFGFNPEHGYIGDGEIGYIVNTSPFKERFAGIVINQGSYQLGWYDEVRYRASYKPSTLKESFGGIATISVVTCLRHSPATNGSGFDSVAFQKNAKDYFENWGDGWWDRRTQKLFRSEASEVLATNQNPNDIARELRTWLDLNLAQSPIEVIGVAVEMAKKNPADPYMILIQ